MGGHCCSAGGRRVEENRQPLYYYYPRTLDGHEHVSFTGLQTPYPDTYRAPPMPLPHNVKANNMPKNGSQMVDKFEVNNECEHMKCSECKSKTNHSYVEDAEDVCPTCLDEYDSENPRIITKCQHHFHLSCILEWMERSDTCPICDKIMMIA